jgi:phage replication initiation protein
MPLGPGEFLNEVRRCTDGTVTGFTERKGLHGYAYSAVSDVGNIIVAWGGNNETVFLQFSGDGCARVACFPSLADYILHRCGHITRCDVAFDDFAGKNTVDDCVSMYLRGDFCAVSGGAKTGASAVSCSQAGNWIQPDRTGRTFYVGKARNGKMLRAYEKGRALGDPSSEWVRWEVQFTNRDRSIPVEILTNPADFARGAYPALAFISGEECRLKTRRVAERISLCKLTYHARESYGALLNVLSKAGIEAGELVERIRRDATPKRLSVPTDSEIMARGNELLRAASEEQASRLDEAARSDPYAMRH